MNPASRSARPGGYTLLELLLVITIVAVIGFISVPALESLNGSGKFNQSLTAVAGLLEQSRSYAVAQDTYVWVVFYEVDTPGKAPVVHVGAFASGDGTDPFNDWNGNVVLPTPGTVGATTLYPVARLVSFEGTHLQLTSMPEAPVNVEAPATSPTFTYNLSSGSGAVLSPSSSVYWVIQFTPGGAARNGPNPIASIWIGLQPAKTPTVVDKRNVASIEINGLTGLTTVHRS